MPDRKQELSLLSKLAVGIATLTIGIAGVWLYLMPEVDRCPDGTVPTHHAGECRPLLTIETDTTFPWEEQQAEAKEFFRHFQENVAADRRTEVADMMMYPLRVNYYKDPRPTDYRFLKTPADLLAVYDNVFHKSVKDYIARYDANGVWGNDYFLQTGSGQIGIYCKTFGDCPECSFEFKVKLIHSNSIYRDAAADVSGDPIELKGKR